MKRILLIALIGTSTFGQVPKLPESFTTKKGIIISNAKLTGRNEDSIKVMHSGGIVIIPHIDLPPEVLQSLGVEAIQPAEPQLALPDPFATGRTEYKSPELRGVEPDGIRISHSLGTAKVPYEDIPSAMQAALGGFDPERAKQFRDAEAERNRAAYSALQKAKRKTEELNNAPTKAAQQAFDEEKKLLLANPNLISQMVAVELNAGARGGRNRDTTFKTDYGSYARTDTSTRNLTCTISSVTDRLQRVRVQCVFLTREVNGGKNILADVVADAKVSLGPNAAKILSTTAEAQQSDEKYVALGMRIKEGVKYIGWCWRAIDGLGRVTAVCSSSPGFDRYGWSTPLE